MTKDINKLGEALKERITTLEGLRNDVEGERQDIGTDLRVIWDALENGQTVNGATNKKEWCAFAKITPRYAQYLVKDGSRKNQTRTVVRVLGGMKIGLRGLTLGAGEGEVNVDFEKVRIDTYQGKRRENGDWTDKADKNGVGVWQHNVREISGLVSFELEDETLTQEQVIVELLKKMKSGLKAMHLWDDKLVTNYEEYVQEYLGWEEDRHQDRSRSAKKAAETRKRKASKTGLPTKTSAQLDRERRVSMKKAQSGNNGILYPYELKPNLQEKFRAQQAAKKAAATRKNRKRTFAERSTVRTQTVGGFFAYYDPRRDKKGEKPWVLVIEGATKAELGYRRTREEAEQMVQEKAKSASYVRFLAQDKITEYDKFLAQEKRNEEHTGQHEDCIECFQHDQALQAKRNTANDKWKKRVDSLIRQWRQMRLRNPKKYRAEFEKAAATYLKNVGDYGKNSVLDGRGRMEAAIANESVNTRIVTPAPEEPLSEPAKALAATVDGADVPKDIPQHVVERVQEMKRRAVLGLPQGDTRPNEKEEL